MKRLFSIFVLFVALCAIPFPAFAARKLENKPTTIVDSESREPWTYATMLRVAASVPVQGQQTVEVFRRKMRLIDACEAAEKTKSAIVLEDADYDFAVQLVESTQWPLRTNRDVITFTDDLKAAPRVEPEKKSP